MTENLRPDPGFWSKTAWIQIGYSVWVSMTMIGIGLAFGFPAVTLPQLKDSQSGIEITTSDEGWIASVLTLVAPAGCLVCGYLMDKLGRKPILIMCELPLCVGWMYTGFATTAFDIIIGRIITGVGIGMAMGSPRIYITEISLPNIRGAVGALPNLAMSVGLTILAVIGAYVEWKTICYLCGGYSLLLLLMNILLPETPYFVLLKSTPEQARETLKKFRSRSYQLDREMNEMLEYKTVNNIHRLYNPHVDDITKILKFKQEFCHLFTKSSCKPFWIVVIYMLLSQLAGVTIIFMWTIDLIEGSKSSIDANLGNVLMGLTRFFTGILSTLLLYRIGRRPQALVSSIGVGVSYLTLGSLIHTKSIDTVVPVVCYVLVVMFATIGYYTIPLLIMYELYPLQVRGCLGGITVSLLNFFMFGANKLYPYLRDLIGHPNVILCFGISSVLGTIFLYFYLPETKDLTLQEIEEYFNDRRATLVSQRSVIAAQLSQGSGRSLSRMAHKSQINLKREKSDTVRDKLQLRRKNKDESQAENKESSSQGPNEN